MKKLKYILPAMAIMGAATAGLVTTAMVSAEAEANNFCYLCANGVIPKAYCRDILLCPVW